MAASQLMTKQGQASASHARNEDAHGSFGLTAQVHRRVGLLVRRSAQFADLLGTLH